MDVIIGGYCWLDMAALSEDQLAALRYALTIQPSRTSEFDTDDPDPIELFREHEAEQKFGVPRQWYLDNVTEKHDEQIKLSDGGKMGEFESLMSYEGPFKEQETAIGRLMAETMRKPYGGAILKAGCAFGKTNTALAFAHRLGRRTLIVVHKEFLANQWRRRIAEFLPGARVGIVRQAKCQYEDRDFVVAMIGSLASKKRAYPPAFYEAFGLVVFDEVHRVGAETWAPVAPQFNARWRLGLTATDRRKDDCENVFWHHIGPVVYKATTQSVVPMIRKIYTDTRLRAIMRYGKMVNASKLSRTEELSQLTSETHRIRQIMEDVAQGVKAGRKVMVLSERLEHIREMAEVLTSLLMAMSDQMSFAPTIDYYTGEWFTGELDDDGEIAVDRKGNPKKKRRTEAELDKAEEANVIFATNQMVQEGLDIQALDVLVVSTPISDVEQAAGRVRRPCLPKASKCERLCPWRAGACEGKPRPIITEVIDESVPSSKSKWRSRARFYRSIGAL